MKNISFIITLLITFSIFFSQDMNAQDNRNNTFKTPEEAALAARNSLLGIMENNDSYQLPFKAEELRHARVGKPIPYFKVDFDQLLRSENVNSFEKIAAQRELFVVPFMRDARIVTVATVGEKGNGWKIAGIADASISDDLNRVSNATDGRIEGMQIREVPNIQGRIYQTILSDGTRYFTDFNDFQFVSTFKHSMTNGWWLNDAVTCMKNKRFSLIFIDNFDPSGTAEDELKKYFMKMYVVGDWTTLGNTNQRCNDRATLTAGNKIAVQHSCTTNLRRTISIFMVDNERRNKRNK